MSELLANRITSGRCGYHWSCYVLASRQSDTHTPFLPTGAVAYVLQGDGGCLCIKGPHHVSYVLKGYTTLSGISALFIILFSIIYPVSVIRISIGECTTSSGCYGIGVPSKWYARLVEVPLSLGTMA